MKYTFNTIKQWKTVWIILLTVCLFILIYLLNKMYPVYADDWSYSFVFREEPKKIESFLDIIRSQYNHYMTWGGRVVVHSIAQFLLMIDPLWRIILNTLVYIIYVYFIYYIANYQNRINLFLYISVFLLTFISLPVFMQTVLWVTGSANYLWGTLIVLPFVFCYYKHFVEGSSPKSILYTILFFLYGIIVGWTNENGVIALLSGIFLYIIYLIVKKEYIPKWIIVGFIGLCIGAALLVMAPGNFIRAEVIDNAIHFSQKSTYSLFKIRLKSVIYIYTHNYSLLILSIICLILFYYYYKNRIIDQKRLIGAFIFFIMAHVSVFVMMAAPIFPMRATFCSVTYLIISLGILCGDKSEVSRLRKIINGGVLLLLITLFAKIYYQRDMDISDFSEIMKVREQIIIDQKNEGNLDIIFTKKIDRIEELQIEELSSDSTYWFNEAYCLYYGIKSVKLVTE